MKTKTRLVLPFLPVVLTFLASAFVEIDLTPELLVTIAATTLALAFDYFPKLAEWYDALAEAAKRQVMFVLLFSITAVIFAGGCLGVFTVTALTCDALGVFAALKILFYAVGGNYLFHKVTKPTQEFKIKAFNTPG